MYPTVTVVTVTYNAEHDIGETARSIRDQQHARGLEWLVVDGNSSDRTIEIAKAEGPTDAKIIQEDDSGIYDAMNKGLRAATGEFVIFMNAGDAFASPTAVEILARAASSNPAGAVGDSIWHNDEREFLHRAVHRTPLERWIRGWNHQSVLANRAMMLKIGGFDLRYPTFADYHLLLRLTKQHGPLLHVDAPVARFRMGDTPYHQKISEKVEALKDVDGRVAGIILAIASALLGFARTARILPRNY